MYEFTYLFFIAQYKFDLAIAMVLSVMKLVPYYTEETVRALIVREAALDQDLWAEARPAKPQAAKRKV